MTPEPAAPAVDGLARRDASEPAVGVGGQGIGVHDERAGCGAVPAADHGRAGPRRGRLDMIGLPGVERAMDQTLVVEIAVAAIDGQRRCGNGDEISAWAPLDGLIALARRDDDNFLAEACRGP